MGHILDNMAILRIFPVCRDLIMAFVLGNFTVTIKSAILHVTEQELVFLRPLNTKSQSRSRAVRCENPTFCQLKLLKLLI